MARTKKAEEALVKESNTFAYDKVFAMYDHKIAGSTLYQDRTVAKKPKSTTVPKDVQASIVTSAQQVGWRDNVDDLRLGLNLKGTCRRTFHDRGHL